MTTEQIEKLEKEMHSVELKAGSVYVITYDINQVRKTDAKSVEEWLLWQGIRALVVGRDGENESFHIYKVTEERIHTNAHV